MCTGARHSASARLGALIHFTHFRFKADRHSLTKMPMPTLLHRQTRFISRGSALECARRGEANAFPHRAPARAALESGDVINGVTAFLFQSLTEGLPFSLWEKGWDEGLDGLLTFGSLASDEFARREFIARKASNKANFD